MVVLVHGLWLGGIALAFWRRQFERRGLKAISFAYPSRDPFAANAKRLAGLIAALPARNVYCMGHSLGGLLILDLLRQGAGNDDAVRKIRRVVLAGTPVAGSQGASRLAKSRVGRWLVGGAAAALETRSAPEPNASQSEIGVIAGTGGVGLGRLFGGLRDASDGAVTVSETRLANARDSIALPVSHSAMLLSSELVTQACSFFATGHFDHHD